MSSNACAQSAVSAVSAVTHFQEEAPAMQKLNDSICYRTGTHRIRNPQQTLARVSPHMESMGITRIADVTGLDTIGIPVVMVCRPNSRSVSVSQGKGHSLEAAKVSGLMESIESFHAEHINLPLRIATLADLQQTGSVVDTDRLPQAAGSPFDAHFPISWIESTNLIDGSPIWLPYEMVHTNYTYPRPSGAGCFHASSNGLASGNSIDEATIHGICEVVERDALTLWQQLNHTAIDRTSLNRQTIDSALCQQTLAKLDAAEQDTRIWDITTDTGLPGYFCVIRDRSIHSQHIGIGSGTHLSREVALLRALHEAVQVRTTYIVGARDDITRYEYTDEGRSSKHEYFQRYIDQSSFTADFSRTTDLDTGSVQQDLNQIFKQLRRCNITQVLRVDLRKPQYDINVVRIVVPGLEAPHDDDSYQPGVRALSARQDTPL